MLLVFKQPGASCRLSSLSVFPFVFYPFALRVPPFSCFSSESQRNGSAVVSSYALGAKVL